MKPRLNIKPPRSQCMDCMGWLDDAGEYHPYLFCELVKLGHEDPAAYLANYGFRREATS